MKFLTTTRFLTSLYLLLMVHIGEASNCTRNGLCQSQLETLRIQEIKSNILGGLGMTKPPRITKENRLSESLKNEYRRIAANMDLADDLDAKTVTTFIQARNPVPNDKNLAARFDFPEEDSAGELIEASLSFSVRLEEIDGFPVINVFVYEKDQDGNLGSIVASRLVNVDKNHRITVRIPTEYILQWYTTDQAIYVDARYNGVNVAIHPQDTQQDSEKMLLQLKMAASLKMRRGISPVCDRKKQTAGCCMYDLNVDFESIGWEWIIAPPTYNAYVCQGNCAYNTHHFHNSENGHSRVMQALLRDGKASTEVLNSIGVCCHPTSYESMRLVYINKDGRVSVAMVNGMIARKCSCL